MRGVRKESCVEPKVACSTWVLHVFSSALSDVVQAGRPQESEAE